MEGLVATKLEEFEQGKISRRRLIETLTLAAAATATASTGASAAQAAGPKAALVNHISYTCPNFKQAADWYSKVFNLDQVGLKDTELTLPFGKMGEQPYNVTAKDVPLTFLLARTRSLNSVPAGGTAPRPTPSCVIDHIALTIADFNRDRAKVELTALGVQGVRDGGAYSLHMTDPFGYDVQVSGLENNAISDGA